jgi:hypothetical protein
MRAPDDSFITAIGQRRDFAVHGRTSHLRLGGQAGSRSEGKRAAVRLFSLAAVGGQHAYVDGLRTNEVDDS